MCRAYPLHSGNTFGFDIFAALPGLEGFVKGQVDANLGPMMYNPNTFTINLEELLSGTPLDTACGVLQVTIWNARNLKAVKLTGGTPDPYIALSIDDKGTLAKTKYKRSTSSPQFKSTHFLLLNSLNGMLTFGVMDFNEHRPDSRIGQAVFDVAGLEHEPEHENIALPVVHEGKDRGSLQTSLSFYPVLKPSVGADGKPEPLPETRSGVVRLTIHQVKGLEKPAGLLRDSNPKARMLLNGVRIKETRVVKKTLDPIFEEHMEFLVTNRGRVSCRAVTCGGSGCSAGVAGNTLSRAPLLPHRPSWACRSSTTIARAAFSPSGSTICSRPRSAARTGSR